MCLKSLLQKRTLITHILNRYILNRFKTAQAREMWKIWDITTTKINKKCIENRSAIKKLHSNIKVEIDVIHNNDD